MGNKNCTKFLQKEIIENPKKEKEPRQQNIAGRKEAHKIPLRKGCSSHNQQREWELVEQSREGLQAQTSARMASLLERF